jgi:hypothetical protein
MTRSRFNHRFSTPERSKATILGIRVERIIFGCSVEDGPTMHPIGAARAIVPLADQRVS